MGKPQMKIPQSSLFLLRSCNLPGISVSQIAASIQFISAFLENSIHYPCASVLPLVSTEDKRF